MHSSITLQVGFVAKRSLTMRRDFLIWNLFLLFPFSHYFLFLLPLLIFIFPFSLLCLSVSSFTSTPFSSFSSSALSFSFSFLCLSFSSSSLPKSCPIPVLAVSFLASWSPYAILAFLNMVGLSNRNAFVNTVPVLMAKSATLWDPLIFIIRMSTARRRHHHRLTSRSTNRDKDELGNVDNLAPMIFEDASLNCEGSSEFERRGEGYI